MSESDPGVGWPGSAFRIRVRAPGECHRPGRSVIQRATMCARTLRRMTGPFLGGPGGRRPGRFEGDMGAGVPYQERKTEPGGDEEDADRFGGRPQAVGGCQVAGEQGRRTDGDVSGSLVEPSGQTPARRPHKVDFHIHGHRPRHALVDAQQDVRGQDPPPGRAPRQDEGHRHTDEPPCQEELPAPETGLRAPAARLVRALARPKATMKEKTAR